MILNIPPRHPRPPRFPACWALGAALLAAACQSGPRWTLLQGTWQEESNLLRLTAASEEWSLAVREGPPRPVTVEAEIGWRPSGESAQAGLVFGYTDAKNFGLCVLSQAPFRSADGRTEICRTIALYQVVNGKEEQVNACPWIGVGEGTHRLKVIQAGPQVMACLEGRPVLQWCIPALGPGRGGVAARRAPASFRRADVRPTPADARLTGPFNVPHDDAGAVVPRWSFRHMIERSAEFSLWAADHGVGNWVVDEAGKRWPPYVYFATIRLDGTMDFATNYPPEQFTPYINGFLDYHQFTGDPRGLERAAELARWLMAPAHNTPADWPYPNLAYTTIDKGKMGGHVEGDLISLEEQGYMALAILRLYHLTADKRCLDYAAGIADTLLKRQLPEGHWPYRVNPKTGEPDKDFTANLVDNILFLDEMHAITGAAAFREASERAWQWIVEGPMRSNRWLGIFGDVASNAPAAGREENYAPWVAQWAARYLLRRRGDRPDYVPKAEAIRQWVVERFLLPDANGEPGIAEQARHRYVMPSHGFRQAMLETDLFEATGREAYRKMALHLMDSGMYATEWSGLIRTYLFPVDGPSSRKSGWGRNASTATWWSNQLWAPTAYLHAMAAFPERAPRDGNHLLRASAPLTSIRYAPDGVAYGTARASVDRLVTTSKPKAVRSRGTELPEVRELSAGDGWTYDLERHVLDIRHPGGEVAIVMR